MKILHLSDLHIGKRVNDFSMIEDQKHIFGQIIDAIGVEKPEVIIIAGDVYDKQVPSAEAVELFDDFLEKLAKCTDKDSKPVDILIISGNHDSVERLSFASRLMIDNVHISKAYNGSMMKFTRSDANGVVNFYLLPFIKPVYVRAAFPDAEITSYNDAMKCVIDAGDVDEKQRNVLITHQFITNATRCDSEDMSVGGVDNIDASQFAKFDYVALGHLHGPQFVERETIRYCGSPLKYSISECDQRKSLTFVDMEAKGNVNVYEIFSLKPLRDVRVIKGTFDEMFQIQASDDYLRIILTDEDDVPNAIGNLRARFPNIMELLYDNKRTQQTREVGLTENVEQKSPIELFGELFTLQNNTEMSAEQRECVDNLINKIWE